MKADSMPAGRPTKYKPEYCQQLVEFFRARLEAYEANEEPDQSDEERGPRQVPTFFPTFARFAVELKVCEDTLKEWAKAHPEFFAAKKEAKAIQHAILTQGAIGGKFVPSVAIFTMKNIMGWRDKVDATVEGNASLTVVSHIDGAPGSDVD